METARGASSSVFRVPSARGGLPAAGRIAQAGGQVPASIGVFVVTLSGHGGTCRAAGRREPGRVADRRPGTAGPAGRGDGRRGREPDGAGPDRRGRVATGGS